jgi:hypothetical protein
LDTGDLPFVGLAAQLADVLVDQAHALVVIMSSLPSLYCATTTGSTAWMQRKTPLTRIATGLGDDGVLHLRASVRRTRRMLRILLSNMRIMLS